MSTREDVLLVTCQCSSPGRSDDFRWPYSYSSSDDSISHESVVNMVSAFDLLTREQNKKKDKHENHLESPTENPC